MGARWTEFSPAVRDTLKTTVVNRFSRMITQVREVVIRVKVDYYGEGGLLG